MGVKELFENWGKLIAGVIAFLAFPGIILGILAAFKKDLQESLIWTGWIVGVIYAFTGLIAGYVYSIKIISRKEFIRLMEEKGLIRNENAKQKRTGK